MKNNVFFLSFSLLLSHFFLVCHLLRSGVAAIFGPQSSHTASHVQSICDTMEVSFCKIAILLIILFWRTFILFLCDFLMLKKNNVRDYIHITVKIPLCNNGNFFLLFRSVFICLNWKNMEKLIFKWNIHECCTVLNWSNYFLCYVHLLCVGWEIEMRFCGEWKTTN